MTRPLQSQAYSCYTLAEQCENASGHRQVMYLFCYPSMQLQRFALHSDHQLKLCLSLAHVQLSHVLNAVKFTLAVPGAQILSEGMTKADVQAAMDQLRQSAADGELQLGSNNGQATSLMQTAARRLSQEAAIHSHGSDAGSTPTGVAAPAARRVSAEAAATAATIQEASNMGRLSTDQQQTASADEDAPEPLDVETAVNLAEACAQVWLQSNKHVYKGLGLQAAA
jgi:hypothetical protein